MSLAEQTETTVMPHTRKNNLHAMSLIHDNGDNKDNYNFARCPHENRIETVGAVGKESFHV